MPYEALIEAIQKIPGVESAVLRELEPSQREALGKPGLQIVAYINRQPGDLDGRWLTAWVSYADLDRPEFVPQIAAMIQKEIVKRFDSYLTPQRGGAMPVSTL